MGPEPGLPLSPQHWGQSPDTALWGALVSQPSVQAWHKGGGALPHSLSSLPAGGPGFHHLHHEGRQCRPRAAVATEQNAPTWPRAWKQHGRALHVLCVLRVCFCAIWGENSGHLWSWTEKHPTSPSYPPPTEMSAPMNVAANPGREYHPRPRHQHELQVLPTVLCFTLTPTPKLGCEQTRPCAWLFHTFVKKPQLTILNVLSLSESVFQ